MKRTRLFTNAIGVFVCMFLFIGCPSECENDEDGDCYTPYGPCDEVPENTINENQKNITPEELQNE